MKVQTHENDAADEKYQTCLNSFIDLTPYQPNHEKGKVTTSLKWVYIDLRIS